MFKYHKSDSDRMIARYLAFMREGYSYTPFGLINKGLTDYALKKEFIFAMPGTKQIYLWEIPQINALHEATKEATRNYYLNMHFTRLRICQLIDSNLNSADYHNELNLIFKETNERVKSQNQWHEELKKYKYLEKYNEYKAHIEEAEKYNSKQYQRYLTFRIPSKKENQNSIKADFSVKKYSK